MSSIVLILNNIYLSDTTFRESSSTRKKLIHLIKVFILFMFLFFCFVSLFFFFFSTCKSVPTEWDPVKLTVCSSFVCLCNVFSGKMSFFQNKETYEPLCKVPLMTSSKEEQRLIATSNKVCYVCNIMCSNSFRIKTFFI